MFELFRCVPFRLRAVWAELVVNLALICKHVEHYPEESHLTVQVFGVSGIPHGSKTRPLGHARVQWVVIRRSAVDHHLSESRRKSPVEKSSAFLCTRRTAQYYSVQSGEKPSFLYLALIYISYIFTFFPTKL